MATQFYVIAFRRTLSVQKRQPMSPLFSQILLLPFNQNLLVISLILSSFLSVFCSSSFLTWIFLFVCFIIQNGDQLGSLVIGHSWFSTSSNNDGTVPKQAAKQSKANASVAKGPPEQQVADMKILRTLAGYLWMRDNTEFRLRVLTALGFLVGAKVSSNMLFLGRPSSKPCIFCSTFQAPFQPIACSAYASKSK